VRREKRGLLLWVVLDYRNTFRLQIFLPGVSGSFGGFRVTRPEALKSRQKFCERAGENVGGYRSAIVFSVDDDAKTYLERELD